VTVDVVLAMPSVLDAHHAMSLAHRLLCDPVRQIACTATAPQGFIWVYATVNGSCSSLGARICANESRRTVRQRSLGRPMNDLRPCLAIFAQYRVELLHGHRPDFTTIVACCKG
jgi:hypothetical protein